MEFKKLTMREFLLCVTMIVIGLAGIFVVVMMLVAGGPWGYETASLMLSWLILLALMVVVAELEEIKGKLK